MDLEEKLGKFGFFRLEKRKLILYKNIRILFRKWKIVILHLNQNTQKMDSKCIRWLSSFVLRNFLAVALIYKIEKTMHAIFWDIFPK